MAVRIWKRPAVVVDPLTAPYVEGEPLPPGDPCANCGDRTPGCFCRHCGQARRVVHVSLREMLADFVDDQLALNSRLPRTVAFLLVRPGYLTREYLRGRIASYIRPLRLYLGTSVLFFLVFALAARMGNWIGGGPAVEVRTATDSAAVARADSRRAAADSVRAAVEQARQAVSLGTGRPAPPVPAPPPAPAATAAEDLPSPTVQGMGAFGDTLNTKFRQFKKMEPARRQAVILDGIQEQLPRLMFAMLPVFALLLKLLYLRSGRFYVEHFVFALHFHAFAFLLLTLLIGVEQVPGAASEPLIPTAAIGWIYLYLFLAMKKVYGQGIVRTGIKYAALLFAYFLILVLGLVASLLAFVYFL